MFALSIQQRRNSHSFLLPDTPELTRREKRRGHFSLQDGPRSLRASSQTPYSTLKAPSQSMRSSRKHYSKPQRFEWFRVVLTRPCLCYGGPSILIAATPCALQAMMYFTSTRRISTRFLKSCAKRRPESCRPLLGHGWL